MSKLLQLVNKNHLILILILFLILSNLFTYFKIDTTDKEERKKYKEKIDSLHTSNLILQGLLIKEKNKRVEIIIKDSILINELLNISNKDKKLINKQKQAINKYKNMSNDQLLNILDSLYKIENNEN